MVATLSPDMQPTAFDDLDGLPIDAGKMFADHKGVHKPRVEKKQRALLRKLTFIKDFLEEGETLFVVTTAVSPTSFFEQLTTGYIFAYIKRCLLVVTDRRIIHIPTKMNYGYRRSIAQIRYGDIESIAQKGSRLKIKYKNGEKDLFLYIRRAERKKIRALLPSLTLDGQSSKAGKRVHMCPRCSVELETDTFECANCRLEFKSKKKARTLSMWLPGGGYFYTGHPFLGIGDALFELLLTAALVLSLIPTEEYPDIEFAGAAFIGTILLIEKMITVYHANHFVKEYLTKEKDIGTAAPFA